MEMCASPSMSVKIPKKDDWTVSQPSLPYAVGTGGRCSRRTVQPEVLARESE